MRSTARRLALRTSPPFITDWVRARRSAGQIHEWAYLGSSWPEEGTVPGTGWADESVSRAQAERLHEHAVSVAAPNPLGSNGDAPHPATDVELARHNTYLSFAYVASVAAGGRNDLSILDWGGGLGQYAVLARSVLPLVRLEYHCFDLPPMVKAGRALMPDVTFHDAEDEALARAYDLVLASSSLQYVPDWSTQLARFQSATSGYCYLARLPVALRGPSFVILQRPYAHGYLTEYPGWVINRRDLIARAADVGLRLEREFLSSERPFVPGAPEQPEYRGFLFTVSPQAAR